MIENENLAVVLSELKRRNQGGMNLEQIVKFAKKNNIKDNSFFMFLENDLLCLIMNGILKEKEHTYETRYFWNVKNNGRGKIKCLKNDCRTFLSIYNNSGYCFRCEKERRITRVITPWLLKRQRKNK